MCELTVNHWLVQDDRAGGDTYVWCRMLVDRHVVGKGTSVQRGAAVTCLDCLAQERKYQEAFDAWTSREIGHE